MRAAELGSAFATLASSCFFYFSFFVLAHKCCVGLWLLLLVVTLVSLDPAQLAKNMRGHSHVCRTRLLFVLPSVCRFNRNQHCCSPFPRFGGRSRDPVSGEVWVLLGSEIRKNKLVISCLGGKREDADAGPEHTAWREFWEESGKVKRRKEEGIDFFVAVTRVWTERSAERFHVTFFRRTAVVLYARFAPVAISPCVVADWFVKFHSAV